MKKLIALFLVMSLLGSVGAAAFASEGTGSQESVGTESPGSVPVTGNYQLASDVDTYYVDVSWSGMSFTYQAGSKGTWDPDTFTYSGSTEAGWKSSDNNSYGTITLTNKSGTGGDNSVQATLTFAADTEFTYGTVNMKFSKNKGEVATGTVGSLEVVLPSYSGSSPTPQEVFVTPTLLGTLSPFEGSKKLGTITITIKHVTWSDPSVPGGPEIFD